jgi:hypothetical protein
MRIGPNLTSQQLAFRSDCPTPPDPVASAIAERRIPPRLRRSAAFGENGDSTTNFHPLADRENDPSNGDQLPWHHLPARVSCLFAAFPRPHLAVGSIAAPTTATMLLLVSLSKMPQSIPAPSESCPEAFPIKANDYTSK